MTASQSAAPVEVISSLGADSLYLSSMHWTERLGEPFRGDLELLSENASIDLQAMLKKPLSIRISGKDSAKYWLNGFINRFEFAGFSSDYTCYRATIVPSLGLLMHTGGCRIFQDFSTPDIIKKIFGNHGFSGDLEDRLSQTYAKRPYCVQYGESDAQFLQRLMEEEGIYYYFECSEGKHTLVLADDLGAHQVAKGYESVPYRNELDEGVDEFLTNYFEAREFGVGSVVLDDYDFEKPRSPLLVKQNSPQLEPEYEWFDFPGRYNVVDDGQRLARIRMEAHEAARDTIRLNGNCKGLRSGHLFSLADHLRDSANQKYLVQSVELSIQASSMQATDQREFRYSSSLHCQPSTLPFRAPLKTPRPRMHGPHLATVSGKSGEEIWTDQYGRIKIQFPWDRDGKGDENSSCWVRTSQTATGKNFGAMSLPRIGDEVIVEFLDGNPDCPIVTGRVYNAERMPPEALAGAQAKTIFRTRSTKGADATAFHELTFDDSKDKESILFQSERDFARVVENNDSLKVGFEKKTPGDRTVDIYNNQIITIGEGSGAGSYTLKVQKDFTTNVATGSATVQAAKSIVLQCGNSKIEITPTGIQMTAPSFTLKADGAVQASGATIAVKADASLDLSGGAESTLKGGASVTIQGAMVKIN